MRLTKRKKRILNVLNQSSPSGICLLNELQLKCTWNGEFNGSTSRKSDQRKSFNRSILNFDRLVTYQVNESHNTQHNNFTSGLFARYAIWELLTEGYLTYLPAHDEMEIAIGRDACAAFIKLKHGQYAVVGTAIFMSEIVLVGNRPIEETDVQTMAQIPWPIQCHTRNNIKIDSNYLVSELGYLPSIIQLNEETKISTAKKKFKIY